VRFFLFIFSVLFFSQSVALAEEQSLKHKIEVGYLYNFTKFITWPENDLKTFNLCVLGQDPFGSIIDAIERKTVKNKPIRVYRIQQTNEAKHCHIIYFSPPLQPYLVLPGILTVSSLSPMIKGNVSKRSQTMGMIVFFQKENKIKIHVNLNLLRKNALDISAKLLEVADVYEGEFND
jgi:hypothetical protein